MTSPRRHAILSEEAFIDAPAHLMETFTQELLAKFDIDDWERRFPFSRQTSDPMAKNLDKAHQLFTMGLSLARNGHAIKGQEYIASAFLCDSRAVILSHPDRPLDHSPAALDMRLMHELVIKPRWLEESCCSHAILVILQAFYFKKGLLDGPAISSIEVLLRHLEKHPALEGNPYFFTGCLTRAKLHYLRGRLYWYLANGKACLKDWERALKLDPGYVAVRQERVEFWLNTKMKSWAEIHSECQIILDQVHEDYESLDATYALMVLSTMCDPRLGTFEESMGYYNKCGLANSRRAELYGPRETPNKALETMLHSVKAQFDNPTNVQYRILLDVGVAKLPAETIEEFGSQGAFGTQIGHDRKQRDRCLRCGKHDANEGIKLKQCTNCKKVFYCSKRCQTKVNSYRSSWLRIWTLC